MRKVLLSIMLVVLGFSFALPTGTDAAAKTTTMYVSAKGDIVLRVKPAKNAERMGTIKNHSKLTVFSSSKGWSHVQAGKSKGYVYTSALSKKNPNAAKPAPTTVTKGLTPVNGLTLTYSPSFWDDAKETFVVKKDGVYTGLFNKESALYSSYVYIEDKNRLMMGVTDSDVILVDVLYPLKQGTYAKSTYDDGYKVLVESTTKTIKVKAGSFKNVIILRHKDGSREYIAKGIGIIKSTNNKGTIITELVSVKTNK